MKYDEFKALHGSSLWRRLGRLFCLMALCSVLVDLSMAASIKHKSISELIKEAEVIFDAEVVRGSRRVEERESLVWTCQTFAIKEQLKGTPPRESLELCFLGGVLDNQTVEVPGLTIPPEGSRGVFFVGSLRAPRTATPLLGWDQGFFKVATTLDGKQVILSASSEPVVGLDLQVPSSVQFAHGVAAGVLVGGPGSTPIELGAFKQLLSNEIRR